ncbi:MAG: hypothetical protein AAB395_02130 [Patescibacteria group bacterium]
MIDENQSQPIAPIPKKSKWKSKKLWIIIILILLAGSSVSAYYILKQKAAPSVTSSNVQKVKKTSTTQIKNIYFADSEKLYSVNPDTKKLNIVDSNVSSGSGSIGLGTTSPLNSPNLYRVAYTKKEDIYLKEDGKKIKKIDQPTTEENAGYYKYISAWSSDSENLTYSISFDCGMNPDCDYKDEDKNLTGIYWYSLNTGESTKLPIKTSEMWVPNTTKVAYFSGEDNVILRTYDVVSKEDKQLTSIDWSNPGPQLTFSDDGNKIIYADIATDSNKSQIIIANQDNTGKKNQKSGAYSELQFPLFIKDSSDNFVYIKSEDKVCPDGGGGCPISYIYSVIDGKSTKIATSAQAMGFLSDTQLIALTGYAYSKPVKKTLSIINLKDNSTTNLYTGGDQMYAEMYH